MTQINLRIKYKNEPNRIQSSEEGLSLMEALQDLRYSEIKGDCGGSMACATCHVFIPKNWQKKLQDTDNEKSEEEDDILEMCNNRTPLSRLSCQIYLSTELDGLEIIIP